MFWAWGLGGTNKSCAQWGMEKVSLWSWRPCFLWNISCFETSPQKSDIFGPFVLENFIAPMGSLESAQPLYTFEPKNNCDPANVVRVAPLLHKCTTKVGTPARYVQSSHLPTSEKQKKSKTSRGRKFNFFAGGSDLPWGTAPQDYQLTVSMPAQH